MPSQWLRLLYWALKAHAPVESLLSYSGIADYEAGKVVLTARRSAVINVFEWRSVHSLPSAMLAVLRTYDQSPLRPYTKY